MPLPRITRCPENPIVRPGLYDWRMAVTLNPGVIYEDGKFYLYERAAGGLRPFHCYIGAMVSDDGVHFKHLSDRPVFTPEMAGSKYGSVQDARVVKLDGRFYMTYAYRPYAWASHPTGVGVPESYQVAYPGFSGRPEENMTRSGIAVSDDLVHWRHHCWATPAELDDRDVILFPEKINGKYAMLRRPLQFVGPRYGTEHPSIWISFSDDLARWSEPVLIAKAAFAWEDNRIGGSTPPVRTERGWLVLYHGVQTIQRYERDASGQLLPSPLGEAGWGASADALDVRPPTQPPPKGEGRQSPHPTSPRGEGKKLTGPAPNHVRYRLGAMMLDLHDPTKVIARLPHFIMEPEEYYEKHGLYIPDVIFPTAAVVKDDLLHIYYGCCDTAIGLATVPLEELVEHVTAEGV